MSYVAWMDSGKLPREQVGLFIAGSILASAVATYLACWAGISGWRSGLTGVLTSGVIVAIPVLVPVLTVLRLHVIGETLRAFWVLPALALLALIARELAKVGAKVTRIASGVPHGGDLEYADQVTLGRAIEGRKSFG